MIRDERAERIARMRGPRHWLLSDVEQLAAEADAAGVDRLQHARSLGLAAERARRWLARVEEREAAVGSEPFVELRTLADSRVVSQALTPWPAAASSPAPVGPTATLRIGDALALDVPLVADGATFVACVVAELERWRTPCS